VWPAFTPYPSAIKGTWLGFRLLVESSSHKINKSDFCVVNAGELRISGTLLLSHVSPLLIVPSCMSLMRLGAMNA
jgi:hypothetical protein